MTEQELKKYANGVILTGFVLEHEVAMQLKEAGWIVINNKYYIDDVESKVREIDLLAYKVTIVKGINIYTSLIISCKKSNKNDWVLLCRDIDHKNPNKVWNPQHVWTNDHILSFQFKDNFGQNYLKYRAKYRKKIEALKEPNIDVFAFQEMDKSKGTAVNDTNIFNSIVSLMKAQAYELNRLPVRKKTKSLYHFSLLSIIDSNLLKINFSQQQLIAEEIESENYIANYIVNKNENSSRIRFVKSSNFQNIIGDYDTLHQYNCWVLPKLYEEFYIDNYFNVNDRIKILQNILLSELGDFTNNIINDKFKHFEEYISIDRLYIHLDEETNFLYILLCDTPSILEDYIIDFLNKNKETKKQYSKKLKEIFKHEGDFSFVNTEYFNYLEDE